MRSHARQHHLLWSSSETTTSKLPDYVKKKDRSAYPERYTWDLTRLYATDEAWQQEKRRIAEMLPSLDQFIGTLGRSASQLLSCLELLTTLSKELTRLHSYASMRSDEDTRVSVYLGMQQEIQQLYAQFSSGASFIEPEILRLDPRTVDMFIPSEKKLVPYTFYLRDILRRKEHTGTPGEERIIAEAGLMATTPNDIFSIFSNADFPYPTITTPDGEQVRLDASTFPVYRASKDRSVRKAAMDAFFGALGEYRRTFGTQLYSEVKKNVFYTRARRYASPLHAALNANNIPVEVYRTLISNTNAHLSTFHRYLSLRKRILGVDTLGYHDLYAPLLPDVDLAFSVEEAQEHVLASLEPLGQDYCEVVRRSFTERWIDMFPSTGKRSGAYSNGSAYDVHPYILMNFNGKYDDMSTLTHELGHTMHSYFSNRTQPYITAEYSIFVAEVASTLNEALLVDHMLKHVSDDKVRLSILGNTLEGFKGTIFRQAQFAEFELAIHEKTARGESLTGDEFSAMYGELVRRYYGHDKGVCTIDGTIEAEWAYIPHFYYNFYVYQYATSFTASAMLAERILSGDTETASKYRTFISSGGSDYPVNQLGAAGVDMTTNEPFEYTMKKMEAIMDQIEGIMERVKVR